MSVAGIILAAGESRRMGSPKALLRYEGETFLDRLVGLVAPYCSPVIVVLGARAEEIAAGMARRSEARIEVNAGYVRGQISSLQCGLRALPPSTGGVLFTLVDHPAVAPSTVAALVAGAGARPRIPRWQGRRGHPVYVPHSLVAEFLDVPEGGSARDVIERHSAEIEYLDLDDPGVVTDVDDPEAYRRLTGGAAL